MLPPSRCRAACGVKASGLHGAPMWCGSQLTHVLCSPQPLCMQSGPSHWVMKTMQHRGEGLKLLSVAEALAAVVDADRENPGNVLLQPLIEQQLLLEGKPFFIRWVRRRGAGWLWCCAGGCWVGVAQCMAGRRQQLPCPLGHRSTADLQPCFPLPCLAASTWLSAAATPYACTCSAAGPS